MSTNTIRLHRVLRAAPERVYRAFLDPDAMAKWLPPNGFTGKVHHLDTRGRGLVADLGCGPGHVARYLQEQGVDVTRSTRAAAATFSPGPPDLPPALRSPLEGSGLAARETLAQALAA
jgi:hypothetical protein